MTEEVRPRPGLPTPRFRLELRMLRIALFVLMAMSLIAALFVGPALDGAVARGALAPRWLFLPIGVYGSFFLVYCVDRWGLVSRRGYPAGKALFQLVFGIVFALLLLPSKSRDSSDTTPGHASLGSGIDASKTGADLPEGGGTCGVGDNASARLEIDRLLEHGDAQVRVATVEALGFRGATAARVSRVLRLTGDRDARVANAAFRVLSVWSAQGTCDRDRLRAWAEARAMPEGQVVPAPNGDEGEEGAR
ncbi:MAG: hypothetical protein IPK13_17705 [Deltaproteobacteria bacterium]|nr:hypothetical protein [Deltaproteobacteria bacterium]